MGMSTPNLFVIRNGKLCRRTPKNADISAPTTNIISDSGLKSIPEVAGNSSTLPHPKNYTSVNLNRGDTNYYEETIRKLDHELQRLKADYK